VLETFELNENENGINCLMNPTNNKRLLFVYAFLMENKPTTTAI